MLSVQDLLGPLQRLPSTVQYIMPFGNASWRQTWPKHDRLRRFLTNLNLWFVQFSLLMISDTIDGVDPAAQPFVTGT